MIIISYIFDGSFIKFVIVIFYEFYYFHLSITLIMRGIFRIEIFITLFSHYLCFSDISDSIASTCARKILA